MIHFYYAFLALEKRIQTEVPEIKGISWENNGTQFSAPYVEIFFNNINIESLNNKTPQRGNLEIVISLTTSSFKPKTKENLLVHAALWQKLYDALKNFTAKYEYVVDWNNEADLFNGLQRTKISFPKIEDKIITSQQSYKASVIDNTKIPNTILVEILEHKVEGDYLEEMP